MIEVVNVYIENTLGFRLNGKIEKQDIKQVVDIVEKASESNRKLKFYIEIDGISLRDISLDAVKEDFKFWFKHPGLLPNFEKVVLVTDKDWVKKIFAIECALIPTLEGESFSLDQKDEAIKWLETDQRQGNRVDMTFSELVESSMLKFAGGFAIGLLTAGIFSKKQQKNVGSAILLGTIAVSVPLGLKILNNNRQLLERLNCDKTGLVA